MTEGSNESEANYLKHNVVAKCTAHIHAPFIICAGITCIIKTPVLLDRHGFHLEMTRVGLCCFTHLRRCSNVMHITRCLDLGEHLHK